MKLTPNLRIFLFGFTSFLLTVSTADAQAPDPNDLARKIDSVLALDEELVLQAAYDLTRSYIRAEDPLAVHRMFDSITDAPAIELSSNLNFAPFYLRKGDTKNSLALRKRSLELAEMVENDPKIFDALMSLSSHYINVAKADSAALYTNRAEAVLVRNKDRFYDSYEMVYRMRADIAHILGNYKQQGEYLEKAWEVIADNPNHPRRGFLLFLITDFFRQTDDLDKLAYFTEELSAYYKEKTINTPDFHLPIDQILLGDYSDKAVANLERIVRKSDSLNNFNALSVCTIALSRAYLKNGEPEKAIPYLKNAIKRLKDANYLYSNTGERQMLREIYLATDNYKGAYEILMDQKIMEDSLRNSEILSKIADYEVKYQTQQKELELQQTAANKKILTSLLWAGGIVLLLVLYFLYKNRQKNKKLAKQKQLLETTLDEKNVLLKEIHHRVKNSFQIVSSLLYLQSESIDDKEAQLAIKEAQNRVRSMVLIHQKLYNKDQLVGINTKEYFEDLTRDIFESHQFSNKPIRYATDIKPMVLDIETITPIGLILNELITNVLKHAFPEVDDQSEMQLRFDKKGDALVLELQDNGQGMPEEVAESSFGIKLMKALSKKLKADLTFKPGPKQGTLASLEITKFNLLG
ncbi:hypothetical protein BTO09_04140 [Gilvibacter sp. SZ-19]|nr:hypothetical protein BTO09_04140 [Gilvibacter sp. SZ-19]